MSADNEQDYDQQLKANAPKTIKHDRKKTRKERRAEGAKQSKQLARVQIGKTKYRRIAGRLIRGAMVAVKGESQAFRDKLARKVAAGKIKPTATPQTEDAIAKRDAVRLALRVKSATAETTGE